MFEYFYRRPELLIVILCVAVSLGAIGYLLMPRSVYPDVERPQVMVVTQLPGAAAEYVAKNVTRPIEQELYGLSGVRNVQSSNRNEVSVIRAEFEYDKGLDASLVEVNNALQRIRARLPPQVLPPSAYAVGAFTQPVMVIGLSPKPTARLTLAQIRLLAENDIRAAFVTREGIANVEVFGGHQSIVRVDIDPFKLAQFRISAAELQEVIAKTNQDRPIGRFQGGTTSLAMTIYGERANVEQLRTLPITRTVSLGDVATVSLGAADRYSAYHANGTPGIAISVLRAPGSPVEAAVSTAQTVLQQVRAQFPQIDFVIAETQGELIEVTNEGMFVALLHAIIATSIVMLLFLGNLRAVATALLSIPLVFMITLATLWLLGKELNILVMTGIILALGMLVDDAVVVLENIERRIEELHEDVGRAVRNGTREVLFPLLVGTLATVAVIAPLLFIGDFAEKIFEHLVLTVIIAVIVSYFVSVTFIPFVSRFWYRNGVPPKLRIERILGGLYARLLQPGRHFYGRLLESAAAKSLPTRGLLVVLAFVLLIVTVLTVVPVIGREALPPMDTGDVRAHVRFGSNETVTVAEARMRAVEAELARDPRVLRVSTIYGSEPEVISVGSGQLPAEVTLNLSYVSRLQRQQTSYELARDLRRRLSALPRATTVDVYDAAPTALTTIKAPVNLQLAASDWRLLPNAAERVTGALERIRGFSSVSSSWNGYSAEIALALDEYKLRAMGLTPASVQSQLPLQAPTLTIFSQLPTVNSLAVRAYLREPFHSNPYSLLLLPIPVTDGSSVPLAEVARVVQRSTVPLLTTDGLRYTTDVFGYRELMPVSALSENAHAAAVAVLPPGVSMLEKGDAVTGKDSMERMLAGLIAGIALLMAVLIPAYNSFRLTLLSVLILPLAAIGALWALLVFDKALSMPAVLGIILLCSIIIKNSILLMEFLRTERHNGLSPQRAAQQAVQLRYRPILMTAFGTIAGMLPIAAQQAVGLERLSPLAVAAIGGLLLGTALSLFYLPLLYVCVMPSHVEAVGRTRVATSVQHVGRTRPATPVRRVGERRSA